MHLRISILSPNALDFFGVFVQNSILPNGSWVDLVELLALAPFLRPDLSPWSQWPAHPQPAPCPVEGTPVATTEVPPRWSVSIRPQ